MIDMNRAELGSNWLSTGGAYLIVGTVWILSAIFFSAYAINLGKKHQSTNDGCLLAICNVVLSLVGGAIGYIPVSYPLSLVTSCLGAILFPILACIYFRRSMRRPQQKR